MENPPFIRFALDLKVREKIQVLTHNAGVHLSPVKLLRLVDNLIETNGLVLQDDVVGIQKDQVYIAESRPGQVGEHIQPTGARGGERGTTARSRSLSRCIRPSAAEPKR
jgi:hypothetical protein